MATTGGPGSASAQVPQQLGPDVDRLALAVSHGDQFLGAVGAHAHDHQAVQPGLLQPHPEVDAVRPTQTQSCSLRSRWQNTW